MEINELVNRFKIGKKLFQVVHTFTSKCSSYLLALKDITAKQRTNNF